MKDHRVLKVYKVYINDDPGFSMSFFAIRSQFVLKYFVLFPSCCFSTVYWFWLCQFWLLSDMMFCCFIFAKTIDCGYFSWLGPEPSRLLLGPPGLNG